MEQRYFIGITLPKDLGQVISAIQKELLMPQKILTPLVPHITLLEPHLLEKMPPDDFTMQVKSVADSILPLQVTLTRTECFNKYMLYIDVAQDKLSHLHQTLRGLLPGAPADQPFHAHVTLAQAKRNEILPNRLIEAFRDKIDPLLPQTFTVSNLVYFEWIHPRTYALYEI